MSIIVAGNLFIKSGLRDQFIKQSYDSITQARITEKCEDFAVSPDPIDPTRVNIFEKWESQSALNAFRESGPENELLSLVESFDVSEYQLR